MRPIKNCNLEKVVDYLNESGYKVVCIDKDKVFGMEGYWNTIPNDVIDDTGNKPLERRIQYLEHCDFFVGAGSGLSWLAWACKAKVILISSFSKPFCEFQFDCTRIYNDNEKSGYFNKIWIFFYSILYFVKNRSFKPTKTKIQIFYFWLAESKCIDIPIFSMFVNKRTARIG